MMRLSFDGVQAPERFGLEVLAGERVVWDAIVAGPVGVGACEGRLYWWSARSLMVDTPSLRGAFAMDQDIVVVFNRGPAWVVVCTSSVRLVSASVVARLDVDAVVVRAELTGEVLTLIDAEGRLQRLVVGEQSLTLDDDR